MIDEAELARRAGIVVEMGGVVPYCVAFYNVSIRYCVTRAHHSFRRYEDSRVSEEVDEIQVSYVHEALEHAAALSRFFWPSGLGNRNLNKLRKARARMLREQHKLNGRSPLKNRKLRDSLEHFDERLDEYCLTQDAGYFFPSAMIGNSNLADDPTGNIFRLVDPQKKIFVVMGEKYEFGPIQTEIERLHGRPSTVS